MAAKKTGFDAANLGDLTKFERSLDRVTEKAGKLAKAMAGLAPEKPKSGIASFDKWFNEGTSGAANFARGLSSVAAGARLISAHPLALAAIAAVKLGSAVVEVGAAYLEAGIHAATLRRNMQLVAKGQGTTARKVDGVHRIYEALGLSAQDGEKDFSGFAERLNSSFNKPGGTAWLEKLGVRTVDENKNRLDTADIFTNALLKAADQAKSLQDRRDKLEADQKAGKAVDPAEWSKLREDTRALDALLRENFKFGDKMVGAIMSAGSGADVLRKWDEAKSRNPPRSPEDEARDQRIAEKGQELYQSMQALEDMFGRLRAIVTDNLLGPLNALASGLVNTAKWFGFIPKTEKELAKEQAEYANLKQSKEGIRERSVTEENARKLLADANKEAFGNGRSGDAKSLLDAANALDKARFQAARSAGTANPEAQTKLNQIYFDALQKFFAAAEDYKARMNPNALGNGAGLDASGHVKAASVSNSNVGNDQRTFTIGVTVGAGAFGLAGHLIGTLQNAANLGKGTQLSTVGGTVQ